MLVDPSIGARYGIGRVRVVDPDVGARRGIGRVGVVDPGIGVRRVAEAVCLGIGRDSARGS